MLADRAAGFAHIRCVRQHFQKQSFLLFCIAALRCPPLLRRAVPSSGMRTSDHKLFPAALLSCRHVPAPSPQKGHSKKARPTIEPFRRITSRSEEHTSELQSLMRISYAVFCLKKKKNINSQKTITTNQPSK